MAQMQINDPEGPAAMFWQLMELPENQQLAKLAGEDGATTAGNGRATYPTHSATEDETVATA